MTELLTQCNKSFVFIFTLLAITPHIEAQNGDSNTQQGLPVYFISHFVSPLTGGVISTSGNYAFEIWTDSSGIENKKLVSAVKNANDQWQREKNSNNNLIQYDLAAEYDTLEEINALLNGFNVQPIGVIIDEEENAEGSETTLSSNGTPVQWARTNGDSQSGVIYDLAQPIKVIAPTGYTVVLRNVGENEEYDTQQTVVDDVHAVLAATGNLDGKGYGGIFYKSDNNTDWDHWTTTYVAYAKPQTTDTEDQESEETITPQGLPVYTLSQTQVDTLVGANVANDGIYAVEIWTDSSGTENKKLVSAQQINEDWFRKENSNGDIVQYDLVSAYDSFDEVETFLVTEGFMEPLTEQGTAEVTFVFVDGQPTGFIIDEEEDAEGSETTLSSNGTPVQWARTNGDSQSGVIYDLAQPIKVIAPTGYTVVLRNVGENEEYDTQQTVVDDVHAVLAATGNLDGKGYGGIFYKSDNNTDWDHWATTYVAYAKPQSTDTEEQGSEEIITSQGLPVYTLSQTQVDTLVGANVANDGIYAVEIWTDSSGTENKKLVSAQQINEDWFRKENSNGDIEQHDLVPAYDSFDEVISYISSQNLTPTGHIIDEEEEHHGPFNFTITDEIDLNNPQELIDLSSDHDDIWFQQVNLEDGTYIWALSVENDDKYGSTSESSDLMVEMNGSVYEGDFHDYWRDKFEIDVENNSSSNWRENRFDTNESGISELYLHYPEIRGANAHFDFSIVDEIDLNNQQELIDLSADHDDVWFQRVNLEDGIYIWALSVENDDENSSTSESSNLMVEMNGSVYEGDFHDYWRDAFDIMIDNNLTNWREDRFDANPEDIKNLLFQFPEIRGPNAPVSPMVKTDPPKSSLGNKATFVGKIITDGNNRNLSLGFQFSEDLRFNDVIEVISHGDNFETEYDFSKYESKYLYYRAFARNEEFESFGARKRLKIEVLATTKINGAKIMEGGWESSDWFGHYYIQENGWIYHEDLGWCFLVIQKNNHWLWMEKYGWLWTKPSVWPYLYDNENANWLYLLKRKSGPSLFFDRKKEQFLPIHN